MQSMKGKKMKPIIMRTTTEVLGAPKDWNQQKHGECEGLAITRKDDHMFSYWRPSWLERWKILRGQPVRLCVLGHLHPPVALEVTADGENIND